MNPEFAAIERRVREGTNPKDSAVLLLNGIADRIDAALTSQSHLVALIGELRSNAPELANAVVTNTSADRPMPGTVSPDPRARDNPAAQQSAPQNAGNNPQSDVYQARQRLRERGVAQAEVDGLSDEEVRRRAAEQVPIR